MHKSAWMYGPRSPETEEQLHPYQVTHGACLELRLWRLGMAHTYSVPVLPAV